ncbi:MAG: flagellar basal body rod protein FlgB, partial [Thermoguttaceae bacterium]
SVEDFQDRLRKAIERGNQPATPDSLSQTGENRDELFAEISKNPKSILYHDKSNVGLEFQVTEMVKNQMQHNLALTLMTHQFRQLQVAISGRT